jgi:transcription antitermination factor NusG
MFRWYVVNTYSGHENKVKANLEHRIDSMGQTARFRRVVVQRRPSGRGRRSSSGSARPSRSPRDRCPTSTAR